MENRQVSLANLRETEISFSPLKIMGNVSVPQNFPQKKNDVKFHNFLQ